MRRTSASVIKIHWCSLAYIIYLDCRRVGHFLTYQTTLVRLTCHWTLKNTSIAVFLGSCAKACAANYSFKFSRYIHGLQTCETCILSGSNDADQGFVTLNIALCRSVFVRQTTSSVAWYIDAHLEMLSTWTAGVRNILFCELNEVDASYVPLNFANIALFLCSCMSVCSANYCSFQETLMFLGRCYRHGMRDVFCMDLKRFWSELYTLQLFSNTCTAVFLCSYVSVGQTTSVFLIHWRPLQHVLL